MPVLGLRGVLVRLGVPTPPSRPSCTLWEVLVPLLGLGEGPGAAGGPDAPILTFLSPLGGSWCLCWNSGRVLVQLGVLMHPS